MICRGCFVVWFLPAVLLGMGWALAAPSGPSLQDSQEVLRVGKRLFTNTCSRCHFVPDPAVRRDRIWLELVKTTP